MDSFDDETSAPTWPKFVIAAVAIVLMLCLCLPPPLMFCLLKKKSNKKADDKRKVTMQRFLGETDTDYTTPPGTKEDNLILYYYGRLWGKGTKQNKKDPKATDKKAKRKSVPKKARSAKSNKSMKTRVHEKALSHKSNKVKPTKDTAKKDTDKMENRKDKAKGLRVEGIIKRMIPRVTRKSLNPKEKTKWKKDK